MYEHKQKLSFSYVSSLYFVLLSDLNGGWKLIVELWRELLCTYSTYIQRTKRLTVQKISKYPKIVTSAQPKSSQKFGQRRRRRRRRKRKCWNTQNTLTYFITLLYVLKNIWVSIPFPRRRVVCCVHVECVYAFLHVVSSGVSRIWVEIVKHAKGKMVVERCGREWRNGQYIIQTLHYKL